MTADERLEQLLNRAGQTISDLPKRYTEDEERNAVDASYAWAGEEGERFVTPIDYILHLTDVIDRMEWALDTVLNERDYIRAKCCFMCGLIDDESKTCEECGIPEVPEDWRVDDEG